MTRKHSTESEHTTGTDTRPITREQIAALAHAIWIDRGRPEGSDVDIWLEAERQLRGKTPQASRKNPIPADPASAGDPDEDPALRPNIDRQLNRIPPKGGDRSATSL